MVITHKQDVGQFSGASSSVIVHLTSNTTATNTLLAAFCLPGGASVVSVTDNIQGRWIQTGYASSSSVVATELWQCRGIQGGDASVTAIFSAASVGTNVSEWSNCWLANPLDSWSQNNGAGASVTPQQLTPRTTGELLIAVGNSSASVSGPNAGWTTLSVPGNNHFGCAYDILSGSVAPSMYWNAAASASWCAIEAAFLPTNSTTVGAGTGSAGLNPLLQFPEVSVQVSSNTNYLAPLPNIGTGIWTEIGPYVESMSIGPIGRQHELDRVQSTHATITVNGRDGTFNSWNTTSFLYPFGLDPMCPIKVTAAWNGITSPVAYVYTQSFTPQIMDSQNVNVAIDCYDILQNLNLQYLSNTLYAQQVIADGGANLGAYYRLGDMVGSYSVDDSSGNGATGSLIEGASGPPSFGNTGPFLYDPNTAMDATNGSNVLNGGFSTIDNSTESPTVHDPLGTASSWTFETWAKWTSNTQAVPGAATQFTANETSPNTGYITYTNVNVPNPFFPAVGSTISGPGIAANTVVTAINVSAGTVYVSLSNNWTGGGGNGLTFTTTIGGTGSTLFSAANVAGVGLNAVDIRVGATTAASITSFNRVNVGTYNSVNGSYTAPVTAAGNINVLDGAWHHIVVPYSASVASIYVDGSFSASAGTGAGWANPKSITIGTDAGPLNGWVGMMSDVALYSTALSASVIANHYSIGTYFQHVETATAGTSPRLNSVMLVAGLPTSILNVPYPFRTSLYAETNVVTTTSALNYIQTMTESEPGLIFQQPNGLIGSYSRQYQYLNPSSTTSQGIFGDSNAASVVYHYDGPSFQLVQDDLDVWNNVQVQSGRSGALNTVGAPIGGQSGAVLQQVTSPQSASVYGHRTLQGLTSLQMQYDGDALAIAEQYLNWYAFPIQRVTTLMTDSYGNQGQNIPQQLQRGLYDRLTIQYQGQTPGPQFSQDSLIEGISHDINIANGPIWTTTWQMSPYEILLKPMIFNNWTFGTPSTTAVMTL